MSRVASNISFLYFLENNYMDAEKYVDIAINNDRYNAKALVNKGNCLFMKNDFRRAKEHYLEAIGVEADCIEALYNLGYVNKKTQHVHGSSSSTWENSDIHLITWSPLPNSQYQWNYWPHKTSLKMVPNHPDKNTQRPGNSRKNWQHIFQIRRWTASFALLFRKLSTFANQHWYKHMVGNLLCKAINVRESFFLSWKSLPNSAKRG